MATAKRRILFLITTSDWGGAQLFVHAAAKAAKAAGHEVLVAAGGTGELPSACTQDGIEFRHLETLRREISPLHDLAAVQEIRDVIKTFKPDAVHLNSSKMGVVGSIAASIERVPKTIYRIGGWAFLEDLGAIKRAVYLWSEKLTAKEKDVIVTVHPGDEAVAKKERIRPKEKIVTIANGLDLAVFDAKLRSRDDARASFNITPATIVVGTIANAYPPKHLKWYLEHAADELKDRTNTAFLIIGEGPQFDELKETVRRRQLRNVILAGKRVSAFSFLPGFDLFVLPSSKEGMPWSLLEAMAAGLPCIATDVGACRWMLEPDAGIIVPPNDAEAMRNAILDLVDNPKKRAALGGAARLAVESRFRWEDTIKRTLELFD